MQNSQELINYLRAQLMRMPEIARDMTQKNGEKFNYRSIYFRLVKRVNNFIEGGNERLILIPGLRGVGKTTILFQLYTYLTSHKKINQEKVLVLFADELKEYFNESILNAVKAYVENILRSGLTELKDKIFILIDEAHFDKSWDRGVKIIYDRNKNVFLFVTGSSALSMEISADVARRAIREPLFPLNFSEYLILKRKFFPERNTSLEVKNVIFNCSDYNIKLASELWEKIKSKAIKFKIDLKREFESFLFNGGFPFGINAEERIVYEKINGMIDRIVERDILTLRPFGVDTRNLITRIIYFLAVQKPGSVSDAKLSQKFGVSSRLIRSVLDVLEKTHLLVSVKPFGGASRIGRRPWKYYFLSPSINAALRYKLGMLDVSDRDVLGLLAEGYAASQFLKIKETLYRIGIFYDKNKGGVDFLILKGAEEVIPIEIGVGKKDVGQVKRAIRKYKARYGIIISNEDEIRKEDDVIYVPIMLFSFM